MNRTHLTRALAAASLVSALALGAPGALAQGSKILKAETGAPGNISNTMTVVLGKIWNRALGVSIQINDSQTLTRSALKLGRGQIDVMPFPTTIYTFLSHGSAMYKKNLHEAAMEASKNVRSIWGWNAVLFHPITFASRGIRTFKDIKGKRVFTGPPSGAAAVTSEQVIKIITGYEANKDYTAVRLPWGSGMQAMLDGKLDLYIRPTGPGAADVEQLGLKEKFYLIGIGDAAKTEAWKKFTNIQGRGQGVIPAGTYKSQVNNDKDVLVAANTFQYAVRKGLPAEMVYQMTKLTWDDLGEIHETAAVLRTLTKAAPFTGVNMPLHEGAVRYYREQGIAIPAGLIPPEAK